MNREDMLAYWNYSRVARTIPEKDLQRQDIQQFLGVYCQLENMFFEYMGEVNRNLGIPLDAKDKGDNND